VYSSSVAVLVLYSSKFVDFFSLIFSNQKKSEKMSLHQSWRSQAEKQQDHTGTSAPDVEIHLRAQVLASLLRFPASSRSTLCEGLLFGTRVLRKQIIAASDTSSGDDVHACAVPSVLISRAQCTGTSQSFYSSEGDVNPEYVKAREQHVGLDVVGWFVYREKNTSLSLSTRQIIVTRSLSQYMEAVRGTVGAQQHQPVVAVMTTDKMVDTNGISFRYQILDHNLCPVTTPVKLTCAERHRRAEAMPSMSLGDTTSLQMRVPLMLNSEESDPNLNPRTETVTQLENFGSSVIESVSDYVSQQVENEKRLVELLGTLAVLRRHATKISQ
jgi:hypothetical protein